jgi:Ca2+-binding RTX toxin-like protein
MRRTVLLLAVVAACLVMASGVALAVNKVGTNGNDVLKGTDGEDNLLGLGGQDDIFGKGGSDNLVGGPGKDNVLGGDERPGGGDKNLDGGPDNDVVFGGKGSDNMAGGDGNDMVSGISGADDIAGGNGTDLLFDGEFRGGAKDSLSGGDGDDFLGPLNKPARRDLVACGDGFDRVLADRKDQIARDCEKVFIGLDSQGAFFGSIPGSFFRGLPPEPSN